MMYLDSNEFIDFIEGGPEWAEPLRLLFDELSRVSGLAISIELVLAEVLAPTKRRGPQPAHIKRFYLDAIVWNLAISLMPVSRVVLFETVELRKFTGHKLPDAIHIVTAIQAKCRHFVSRDADARKLPIGLERVVPDRAGVDRLIEAIRAR